ncbi:hypothetical protein NFI96_021645 [Prochilodus magdalenae]|nr:hypothetical protein NFI96_021645 [Prochilodus magdalenae]
MSEQLTCGRDAAALNKQIQKPLSSSSTHERDRKPQKISGRGSERAFCADSNMTEKTREVLEIVKGVDPNQTTDEAARSEERPKWDNKVQYLLTCIGFAVGLGNVWRFPYLCQVYGGGAFLIPYLVALVLEGLPLLHMELAIGQRLRMGSIGVWTSISPYLGGVGLASLMVSFLVGLFYNTILAWVLWYFFHSFQNPLPWANCHQSNLTGSIEECEKSTAVNYFWYRETLNITPTIETSGNLQWWMVVCLASAWCIVYICFIRGIETIGKAVYVTATFPYLVLTIFLVQALTLPGATLGLRHLFTPKWETLMNPTVWLDAATQIFFSLSLAFGGLIAFSSYNPEKNNCERDALLVGCINSATSIYASIPIFSILGFKALSNYNECLDNNCKLLKDKFDIPDGNITRENCLSVVSHYNSTYPSEVEQLGLKTCDLQALLDKSASGTGLAFIVFTEAVTKMPASQLWAILFFIMLFSLGLSSMFGNLEGVLTPLLDLHVVPKWIPKEVFTGLICLVSFLVALIFTQGSGNYWLEILVITGLVELSVPLGWSGRLTVEIVAMLVVQWAIGAEWYGQGCSGSQGRRVVWAGVVRPNQYSLYWQATWRVISPPVCCWCDQDWIWPMWGSHVQAQWAKEPTYGCMTGTPRLCGLSNFSVYVLYMLQVGFPTPEARTYPGWVYAICILLAAVPCFLIPLGALYQLYRFLRKRMAQGGTKTPYVNEGYVVET